MKNAILAFALIIAGCGTNHENVSSNIVTNASHEPYVIDKDGRVIKQKE